MALAGDALNALAVEEHVRGVVAVTTGHHPGPGTEGGYGPGTEGVYGPGELLWIVIWRGAREHGGLRRVGGDHSRSRQQPASEDLDRALVEQARTALGDHHRIQHDRGSSDQVEGLVHRSDRLGV